VITEAANITVCNQLPQYNNYWHYQQYCCKTWHSFLRHYHPCFNHANHSCFWYTQIIS